MLLLRALGALLDWLVGTPPTLSQHNARLHLSLYSACSSQPAHCPRAWARSSSRLDYTRLILVKLKLIYFEFIEDSVAKISKATNWCWLTTNNVNTQTVKEWISWTLTESSNKDKSLITCVSFLDETKYDYIEIKNPLVTKVIAPHSWDRRSAKLWLDNSTWLSHH